MADYDEYKYAPRIKWARPDTGGDGSRLMDSVLAAALTPVTDEERDFILMLTAEPDMLPTDPRPTRPLSFADVQRIASGDTIDWPPHKLGELLQAVARFAVCERARSTRLLHKVHKWRGNYYGCQEFLAEAHEALRAFLAKEPILTTGGVEGMEIYDDAAACLPEGRGDRQRAIRIRSATYVDSELVDVQYADGEDLRLPKETP